jgi:hypothetical protein
MHNVTYTTTISFDENVSFSFLYQNCRVTTATDLSSLGRNEVDEDVSGYFIISIDTTIKDFESVSDAAAHARPMLLIALDILSLFIDRPITPFESGFGTSYVTADLPIQAEDPRLILDGDDYSNELKTFLETLGNAEPNKKRFFYSLMDRWRKAAYMQEESEESQEYDDEAVIAYFHVLELIAEESVNELTASIKAKIEQSLLDIYSGLMHFEGNYLSGIIDQKKTLNNQLILSDLPIAGKILFALQKLGIMSKRLKYFLGNWIKDRNSVAHGRRVYQDRVIFPVPPFFPNAKLIDFSLNTLRTLTAHVICTLMRSEIYNERWAEEHLSLIPTPEEIRDFISYKRFDELTNDQFTNGEVYSINPGSISWYLVDKKLNPNVGKLALQKFFTNIDLQNSDQVNQAVVGAVILADFTTNEDLQKCQEIIIAAYENRWHPFINLRELLSFLEYNNHFPKFLEEMIVTKKVR